MIRVPQSFLDLIVFLITDAEMAPGAVKPMPRASGFFVMFERENSQNVDMYIVTARHCIEECPGSDLFVRMNFGERLIERPTVPGKWFVHESADVAVLPLSLLGEDPTATDEAQSGDEVVYTVAGWKLSGFVSADHTVRPFALAGISEYGPDTSVMVGDDLVFLSLFAQTPGDALNLPIARFGHSSRMPAEPVMFPRSGGTCARISGYLAECQSWGGHSGAPVFWHHNVYRSQEIRTSTGSVRTHEPLDVFALLGLVSGHFDIERNVDTTGDIIGQITAKHNSGIALITPAESIRELLMRDDVVEERERRAQREIA